jgi:hypothetical protein
MGTRDVVWNVLIADPQLNALGVTQDNLFGVMGGDSPRSKGLWVVLHWGLIEVGPGRDSLSNVLNLSVWAYNAQPDWSPVLAVLRRIRTLLVGMEGLNVVSSVQWTGDSEDLWDDVYRAITRNSSYRIAAQGD